MESVPDNPYHEIPYPGFPVEQTHPDRLAAVAALFGMTTAPVTACRLLEVGAGDGGNLIPLAYTLPESSFVGIDLASVAVEQGRRAIGELALANIELIAADLRTLGPELGKFDYIVAHGLYSWVPPEVRESLLRLCREQLAPQGVAFISYNTFPGRHVRLMLREMMLHHTRGACDGADKIQQARAFLAMLAQSQMAAPSWQSMIEDEIERLLTGNTEWLFHDDLAAINEAFYFRDFAAHAASHGLQYLGEAEPHLMFDSRGALAWLGDAGILEREQYLDFLYFRRLRQTLLCHNNVKLKRPATSRRMDGFLFSCAAKRTADGGLEGLHSVHIAAPGDAVVNVAMALNDIYPLPAAFAELVPYAGGEDQLREILFALISSGFAQFHVFDFPCQDSVTSHPRASRLAQWQAARSEFVTCAGHRTEKLDAVTRLLLPLLDGTRGHDELARTLPHETLAERLDWLARMGLLEE